MIYIDRKENNMNLKRLIILMLILCFLLCACNTANNEESQSINSNESQQIENGFQITNNNASIIYTTFEEACQLANIIVVANYVGSKPFGESGIVHEFLVKEKILGNTEDEIHIYIQDVNLSVFNDKETTANVYVSHYNQKDILFNSNAEYLLVLNKVIELYSEMTLYTLINETIIRLDNLSLSEMYCSSIAPHAKGIEFTNKIAREEMISYVKNITKDNIPAYEYIKSDKIEDIINDSQYVITVKIEGNLTAVRNEFRTSDIYDCTIIETLKGEIKAERKTRILFFPDTVKPGEEWIVAAVPPDGRDEYLHLTSKNSLIPIDQKDELLKIIK